MEQTRLVIADDHRMFADGLYSIFQHDPDILVVGIVENGKDLLDLLERKSADVILLDLSMPEMNGEEACAEIRKRYPATRVIIITMHHSADIVYPMIDMGIDGYMLKNSGRTELKSAVNAVMHGDKYFSPEVVKLLSHRAQNEEAEQVQLTRREKEVLELIYQGLPTHEIADKLFISANTVETHRRNLLSKTQTRNATQLINQAIEKGWIQVRPRL